MGRRQGTEEAAQAKGIVLKGVDLETGRELFSFPLGPTIAPGLFLHLLLLLLLLR